MFVLDASGSIGTTNFNKMRTLCQQITGRMQISETAVKVGIVLFHDSSTLELGLSSDGALINSTLQNMPYAAGWTAQIPGIRTAITEIAQNGRAKAAKVLYILTDGLANKRKFF